MSSAVAASRCRSCRCHGRAPPWWTSARIRRAGCAALSERESRGVDNDVMDLDDEALRGPRTGLFGWESAQDFVELGLDVADEFAVIGRLAQQHVKHLLPGA